MALGWAEVAAEPAADADALADGLADGEPPGPTGGATRREPITITMIATAARAAMPTGSRP